MMRVLVLLALAAGGLVVPRSLPAQAATVALAQGVRAYDDLEFDAAAGLLRRALAAAGTDALAPGDRARAHMYLVATELLREHRDSARAVARRLVLSEPRFRPDELVFPPQVLTLYDEVRRSTPVVMAVAAADTAIRPGIESFAVRLYASAVHELSAALVAVDGSVVQTLYRGPISDSLMLHWNGFDSSGTRPPPSGQYAIAVSSLDRARRVVRILRLPLEVLHAPGDTLPHPPTPADTVLRRARHPVGPALRVLAPGLLAGAAIAVLPGMMVEGEPPSGGRLVIGGAVSLVGIAAFIARRPARSIPANVAHNRRVSEWRRSVADVQRRNADRAREFVGVRTGPPVVLTPDGGGRR